MFKLLSVMKLKLKGVSSRREIYGDDGYGSGRFLSDGRNVEKKLRYTFDKNLLR